jgi:hypothetical protein
MKKVFISAVIAVMSIVGIANANEMLKPIDMAAMSKPEGKVPAYLIGAYEDVPSAKAKLEKAGYTIVGTYNVLNSGTTILFTDTALKTEAAKKNRGFMAVLRLYVDKKDNQISITDPIYFGKAFMQDDYSQDVFYNELKTLTTAFSGLKGSVDQLKFDDLGDYHFMFGMPYYEDSQTVGEGSAADLLAKAKAYNGGKSFLFSVQLSADSYIVGYALNKDISEFPKKIGLQNGLVLPYLILIADGKAKILSAKYYLAISYPLLSMGQFMTISSVPGDIEDDLKKPFK